MVHKKALVYVEFLRKVAETKVETVLKSTKRSTPS